MSDQDSERKPENKLKYYFRKYCKVSYALFACNFWHEDFDIPEIIKRIHDYVIILFDALVWILLASEFGSYFTQHNLSEEQKSIRRTLSVIQPIVYSFVHIITIKKQKVVKVFYTLVVKLKDVYNDKEVEKQTIKLARMYCILFTVFIMTTIFQFGAEGLRLVMKGGNFVTIITAWPDVDDDSRAAAVMRVILYLLWWVYTIRIMFSGYLIIILLTIFLSHQYSNLCSYFNSLNQIFDDETLSQEEKERKYEEAYKAGIGFHLDTMKCTNLIQDICYVIFSIHIFINIGTLIMLMLQWMNMERTASNMLLVILLLISMLISTGVFCWNAGDVTVEASKLPTAMFASGWHNCGKESMRRVRPLLLVSMWQSQIPVLLRCLGIVELSYQSYVSIVRSSYSLFSVFY